MGGSGALLVGVAGIIRQQALYVSFGGIGAVRRKSGLEIILGRFTTAVVPVMMKARRARHIVVVTHGVSSTPSSSSGGIDNLNSCRHERISAKVLA